MSWLRNKIQERKDKDVEKRSQTPERGHERSRSKSDVLLTAEPQPNRGRSVVDERVSLDRPVTEGSRATATPATAARASLERASVENQRENVDQPTEATQGTAGGPKVVGAV
jgi:hypothetical protein